MKKFFLLLVILAVGVALGIYFQKQPKADQLEDQVKTGAAQAGADLKEGVQKAGEVATNIAAEVKAGAQKAGAAATNAVGEIKQKLP